MVNQIRSIVIEAGEILLKHFKKEGPVSTKQDEFDFLTAADIEASEFIVKKIATEFPHDQIISEESIADVDYSKKVWLVDPLDGTKNFIRKEDGFCIEIGLCTNGQPVFGLVYSPVRKQFFYATKGEGAFLESCGKKRQITVSNTKTVQESHLTASDPAGEKRPLQNLEDSFRVKQRSTEGSTGLKLTKIAQGNADFFMVTHYKMGKWDTCGGQVILEEAGGTITKLDGDRLDYTKRGPMWNSAIVASNTILHKELLEAISKLGK